MMISVHFNPYFSRKWYNIILYSLIVSGVLLFLYTLGEVVYIPVLDDTGYDRPTGLTKRALVLFGLSMLLFVAALVFHFVYTYYSEHKKLLKKISTEPIPGIPTYSVQNFSIPTSFALTMPPVIDQGALGSCTSNAASNCVRFNEQGVVFQPSRLFIYYNARVKIDHSPATMDTGESLESVFKSMQTYKFSDETAWPYDISKFSVAPPQTVYDSAKNQQYTLAYTGVRQNTQALKEVLTKQPIMFGFQVYPSFFSDTTMRTGVVSMPAVGGWTLCTIVWI